MLGEPTTEDALRGHARVEEPTHGQLADTATDHRVRRRLDLDQLDASIRRVTGGIGWTETRGGREVNLFEDLAASLGKPDYIDSTREDLEASIIFQKFLGDAARSVCDRLVEKERARPANRHLLIHASLQDTPESGQEAINKNISELVLRFHGRYLPADSPKLNPWRFLFQSNWHTGKDTAVAWRAVCVGLITHPDFYTY